MKMLHAALELYYIYWKYKDTIKHDILLYTLD